MNIISTKDMRLLDHIAIHTYHISSLLLMKEAASRLKEWIDLHYARDHMITIVCGPGNNGGDGFALAILLVQDQYLHVHVVCPVEEEHMSEDERFYAQAARRMKIVITKQMEECAFARLCQSSDLVVDALFGNGLTRAITATYEKLIITMNASDATILSVDIASGIHSDSGQIMGCAVKAKTTITFTCATMGHMIYPGSAYGGDLIIKQIGIPAEAFQTIELYPILDKHMVHTYLPKRYAHSHKGTYGKALLVGGSTSMHGAITLCAKSMLRSGVGMLTLFIPNTITSIIAMKMEECMLLENEADNGFFSSSAPQKLNQCISSYDTVIIGNGLGRSESCMELVKTVLASQKPCVMDGDAIFALANHLDLLKQHTSPIVITPHPKEMGYLTGKSVEEIMKDPFAIVKEFAATYHVIVVLKDQYTYISDGRKVYVNTCGNHALAKGGSGDVLCGVIAGLFAQSKDALHASICGVYVHATCAQQLLKREDGNSILPSDLIKELSHVYRTLR